MKPLNYDIFLVSSFWTSIKSTLSNFKNKATDWIKDKFGFKSDDKGKATQGRRLLGSNSVNVSLQSSTSGSDLYLHGTNSGVSPASTNFSKIVSLVLTALFVLM